MIKIVNTVDPELLNRAFKELGTEKIEKIIKSTLEKQLDKLTTEELEEIKTLQRQALILFKQEVIRKAGKQCEAIEPDGKRCKKTKRLNPHHIESYSTNKSLRYNPKNGICFCPTHHKFGRLSAHKSFVFMYIFMLTQRGNDLAYLVEHYKDKVELTKELLIKQILILKGGLK